MIDLSWKGHKFFLLFSVFVKNIEFVVFIVFLTPSLSIEMSPVYIIHVIICQLVFSKDRILPNYIMSCTVLMFHWAWVMFYILILYQERPAGDYQCMLSPELSLDSIFNNPLFNLPLLLILIKLDS